MDAVDITPLLRTKENWPEGWRGTVVGSNDEYVTLVVDAVNHGKLATFRLYRDGGRTEYRLAKFGTEGLYVEFSTFDQAVKALENLDI